MKKALLILAAAASLASCRESNTNVKSAPSAEPITTANTLQFDTTFISTAKQPHNYSYITEVVVGTTKTVTVPVKIAWTTTTEGGCPQVASLQIYQVGGVGSRTSISAKAMRDAACKPGPMPTGTARAATGAVYINLTCQSKEVHAFSNFRFTLNGLGYHDTLDIKPVSAVRTQK
jgi:hypothetical protein